MPIMNIGNVKFSKMDRKISILPSKENLIQPKADFTDKICRQNNIFLDL